MAGVCPFSTGCCDWVVAGNAGVCSAGGISPAAGFVSLKLLTDTVPVALLCECVPAKLFCELIKKIARNKKLKEEYRVIKNDFITQFCPASAPETR